MEIPNFWDIGPHNPLPVEEIWKQFINDTGGKIVSDILQKSPEFENADFVYQQNQIVIELKEVETEFTDNEAFKKKFTKLIEHLLEENPQWRPYFLGGTEKIPNWFLNDYVT